MTTALLILTLVIGVAGLMSLSEATMGVGVIAFGCLVGIMTRIVQATEQHNKLIAKLDEDIPPTA